MDPQGDPDYLPEWDLMLQQEMQFLHLNGINVLPDSDSDEEWDPEDALIMHPVPQVPVAHEAQLRPESPEEKDESTASGTDEEATTVVDDPFPITSSLTFNDLHPWLVEECLSSVPFLKLSQLRRVSSGFNTVILKSAKVNKNIGGIFQNYNRFICCYDAYLAATCIPVRSLLIYEKVRVNKKKTKIRLVVREWPAPKKTSDKLENKISE